MVCFCFLGFFFHSAVDGGKKTHYNADSRQRSNHSAECFCFSNHMCKSVKLSLLEMTEKIFSTVFHDSMYVYLKILRQSFKT